MRCIVVKRVATGLALSASLVGCSSLSGFGESPARIGHDPFTDAQRVDIRPHAVDYKGEDSLKRFRISAGGYWDATDVERVRIEILATGPDYLNLSDISFDVEDREGDRAERINAPGIATTRFGESVRSEGTFLSVRSFDSDMELATRVAGAHSAVLLVNTPAGLLRRQIKRGGNTSPAFHAMRRFLAAVQQVGLDVDGFKYVRRPDPLPPLEPPVDEVVVAVAPLLDEPAALIEDEIEAIEASVFDAPVAVPGTEFPGDAEIFDPRVEREELIDEMDSDESVDEAAPPLAIVDEAAPPLAIVEDSLDASLPRPPVPVTEGDVPVIGIEDISVPEPQMTQAEMEAKARAVRLATLEAEEERRRTDFERQIELARVQSVREVILRDIELMVSQDAERLIMKDAEQVRRQP